MTLVNKICDPIIVGCFVITLLASLPIILVMGMLWIIGKVTDIGFKRVTGKNIIPPDRIVS